MRIDLCLSICVLIVSLTVVFIIIKTAVTHRDHAARSDRRYCKHCSAVYPANAKFCGRCGKQFT